MITNYVNATCIVRKICTKRENNLLVYLSLPNLQPYKIFVSLFCIVLFYTVLPHVQFYTSFWMLMNVYFPNN